MLTLSTNFHKGIHVQKAIFWQKVIYLHKAINMQKETDLQKQTNLQLQHFNSTYFNLHKHKIHKKALKPLWPFTCKSHLLTKIIYLQKVTN